ncbi:MAG: SRPBCC family protein [Acidimicrobiales bacterium]
MTYPTAETLQIAAPAAAVWALVSDLPRMGEWSPENSGGTWSKGASGPAIGAIFVGKNQNGFRRWSTKVTVVGCEPATLFELAVSVGPWAVANWRYEFEDTADGCRVTESWNDNRAAWMRVASRPLGLHDAAHAKVEMAATLSNLARALERTST